MTGFNNLPQQTITQETYKTKPNPRLDKELLTFAASFMCSLPQLHFTFGCDQCHTLIRPTLGIQDSNLCTKLQLQPDGEARSIRSYNYVSELARSTRLR